MHDAFKPNGRSLMDKVSKETRSKIMGKIRGKDTAQERAFQREFPDAIPHPDFLPFRPDFVLRPSQRDSVFVIFLDCPFWHGLVSTKVLEKMDDFWKTKMFRNTVRDFCANAFWGTVEFETKNVGYRRIGKKTWISLAS